MSEKQDCQKKNAVNHGYNPVSVIAVVDDKANYYPDSSFFIIKMVADNSTHKFLGIQVLGKGAVDKIVDIAATALTLNASLEDLENMDLTYAPPFSTAIHPFTNMVNILLNKINGDFITVTPAAYQRGEYSDYKIIMLPLNLQLNQQSMLISQK